MPTTVVPPGGPPGISFHMAGRLIGRGPGHFRGRLDRAFEEIKRDSQHMRQLWRDVAEVTLPSKPRFDMSEPLFRGHRGNHKIVDNIGTRAHGILESGMLAGLMDAASQWFELATVRPNVNDEKPAKEWFTRVRDILLAIFDQSDVYANTGTNFGDQGLFGTGCTLEFPDKERIIRTETLDIGSYHIALGPNGVPDTLAKEVTMTARQIVETFGPLNATQSTLEAYNSGRFQMPVEVRHLITTNEAHRRGSIGPARFPVSEYYWEHQANVTGAGGAETEWFGSFAGANMQGVLQVHGYPEFPGWISRWDPNHWEPWGLRCPGINALGDTRQLQTMVRALTNGINKMVNPPIIGGPGLEQSVISLMAGGKTIDPSMTGPSTGARALHDVRLPLRDLGELCEQKRQHISDTWMSNLFLMLLNDSRSTPPTAEEIRAREREKAVMLGPIQSRQATQVLDPLIGRTLAILIRKSEPFWKSGMDGILPRPPQSLLEEPLRVVYVSDIATTQRVQSIGRIERHLGFVAQVSQVVGGDALDTTDFDEAIQQHARALNLPPAVSRTDAEITEIRTERLRQRQAAALRESLPGMAKAAKDLSQTPTSGGGTALQAVAGAA